MCSTRKASYARSLSGRIASGSISAIAMVATTPVRHGTSAHRAASRSPSSHVYAAEWAIAWMVATRATQRCQRVHDAGISFPMG